MRRDPGELRVFAAPADVATALAQQFVAAAHTAIGARGRFAVALAGGTTPKAAYALLTEPPYAKAIDWHAVHVFFGDERCVPPEDAQSNYRMARETFLQALAIPDAQIHRMRGEAEPQQAANDYRRDLLAVLGAQPRMDLVMLGMGPDGHTASLFPGTDPLTEDAALVRAVFAPAQQQWRITLTPQVINASHAVVFAVEGAVKAKTLAAVREGPYDPITFPAQIVAPSDGTLLWLADDAAAGASR
jgi:6-phosphogluconolactonase